jgi:hypothetical protein
MNKILVTMLFSLFFAAGISVTENEKIIPEKKFKSTDIGKPALPGKTVPLADGLDITAGGADIWGTRDEFRFAYFEHSGDFDLAARIESLTAANLYTKAGLMARENLTGSCRHIFFQVFPTNEARHNNNGGYEFQYRSLNGGEMYAIYPPAAEGKPEFPVNYPNTWIRLKRTENEFTGFYSTDGLNWKVYTTFKMEISKKIFLGLAVTSHNVNEQATAVFKDISMLK